jgi:hypothetical protein
VRLDLAAPVADLVTLGLVEGVAQRAGGVAPDLVVHDDPETARGCLPPTLTTGAERLGIADEPMFREMSQVPARHRRARPNVLRQPGRGLRALLLEPGEDREPYGVG